MSENEARRHPVEATKALALFYHAFYKEFSAEIGPEKTREIMKRDVYKRGLEIGKKFAPSDFAGLSDAFVTGVPDAAGGFNSRLESCSAAGLDIELGSCPLKDAWRETGLSDKEVEILTDIAGAVDTGTFEAAGFSFEPDIWKPGHSAGCRLHIRSCGQAAAQ